MTPAICRGAAIRRPQQAKPAKTQIALEAAVSCRLPAAGPVASHLSGGLDSSAVAVLAARRLREAGRKLHTFSQLARPESKVLDEREYVEAVLAQEPDIEWSPAYLPTHDAIGPNDPDLLLGGAPSWSGALICAAASAAGCEVLLSGAGGDEGATYHGTGLYAAVLRAGYLRQLPRELRAIAQREGKSLLRVAVARLLFPFLPDWTACLLPSRFGHAPAQSPRDSALSFLSPAFAQRVRQSLPAPSDWRNRPMDRVHMLTHSYLVARADNWSILGARHGVAFSYPLADRRILDFTLSLPLNRFVDGGFARQPYRNAMVGILPESIRWRTTKFWPFPDILLNLASEEQGLRARLERVRRSPAVVELFNLKAIEARLGNVLAASRALEFAEVVARQD
ncbi:MAG: asparagine synthase [Acidobacteriia bacterium]|nr:asparagine synthase [Terriglobia bacterium]